MSWVGDLILLVIGIGLLAAHWFKRENDNLKLKDTLTEKRALPVGIKEFHEWSDRIISGACLTATPESQKFALANILINLQATVAFEADIYFIHCLRKTAVNQVADGIRNMIREDAKARLAAEEEFKKQSQNQAEATASTGMDAKVVEIGAV